MRRRFISLFLSLACLLFFDSSAPAVDSARPLVSPLFGDNMVVQRDKPIKIWGWSEPGKTITVTLADHSAKAEADAEGRWVAILPAMPAGGPFDITIAGPETVVLHGVLAGDVWLCGGQSNMYLGLGAVRNGREEIAAAEHPDLRLYLVPQQVSYSPALTPRGTWKVCSPKTVAEGGAGGFSAVAYFFGRKLHQDLGVPIGLIEDCVGGTPVETWTSPEALRKVGGFNTEIDAMERLRAEHVKPTGSFLMHWLDEYDIGGKGGVNWAAAELDDSDWKTVDIPGGFKDLGLPDQPCVCWFRKEVTLPDPLPAGPAVIFLGVVEKMDTTYINGQWVGASSWVENPRAYFIKKGVLKPGKNVIAVRVFKMKPNGGFESKPETLRLAVGDTLKIPLAGEWKGKVSVDARPPHPLPLSFENYPTMPCALYEGMIAPLAPLSLTGVIWYQGEANAERAFQYRTLLPAMIADWRRTFKEGDFPFYIVSLPAFMHRRAQPGDDAWAELREAQALTARDVPNCGLAVTIDTGDPDNIHPKDKKVVGERLALCALAGHYGRKVVCEGPTFFSLDRIPGGLRVHFAHTDGGLTAKGGKAEEFSVAGEDRKWHWAGAKIEGDSVVVSSAGVPDPVAVRYAWQSNPAATLYNGAGLPAVPFRSDNWPEMTEKK